MADTLWNHTIEEADLVIKVSVNNRFYVTEAGSFECEIIKVIKGEYKEKKLSFHIELVENSRERFKKRFDALMNHKIVTIGFTKDKKFCCKDIKINGIDYAFFMSE